MSADQDKAYAALKIAGDTENVAMTLNLDSDPTGMGKYRKLQMSLIYQLGAALTHAVIDVADAIRETRGDI